MCMKSLWVIDKRVVFQSFFAMQRVCGSQTMDDVLPKRSEVWLLTLKSEFLKFWLAWKLFQVLMHNWQPILMQFCVVKRIHSSSRKFGSSDNSHRPSYYV